jgi:hypothetical protein
MKALTPDSQSKEFKTLKDFTAGRWCLEEEDPSFDVSKDSGISDLERGHMSGLSFIQPYFSSLVPFTYDFLSFNISTRKPFHKSHNILKHGERVGGHFTLNKTATSDQDWKVIPPS